MKPSLLWVLLIWLSVPSLALAATPERIRIHGTIATLGSPPVQPIDGPYTFDVRIYNAAVGGSEVIPALTGLMGDVAGGAYSLTLIPDMAGDLITAFSDGPRFIEVTVVSGPNGSIGEMLLPRQEILAVPFALNAASSPEQPEVEEQVVASQTVNGGALVQFPFTVPDDGNRYRAEFFGLASSTGTTNDTYNLQLFWYMSSPNTTGYTKLDDRSIVRSGGSAAPLHGSVHAVVRDIPAGVYEIQLWVTGLAGSRTFAPSSLRVELSVISP